MHSHSITVHVTELNGCLRSYESNHDVFQIRTIEMKYSKNERLFRISKNQQDPHIIANGPA